MTANLYVQHEKYHVMLSWYQSNKRKQKSVTTSISVKGNNITAAKRAMKEILREWEDKISNNYQDVFFSDYMLQWLENVKHSIAETTYYSYKAAIENQINPYFSERKIKLNDIKPHHIQAFYTWKMDVGGVSGNTIHHYHANIHKALKDAVKLELIKDNPASKINLPQKVKFKADYYSPDELRKLVSVVKGTKLEVPVMLVSWFGMRRGEIVGVRWDAINLDAKTLYMCGTITDRGEGTQTENLTYRHFGKTPSSIRTFPLTDEMVTYFKALKRKQWENRILCGADYNTNWLDFVCVDEVGNLIQPEYISYTFPKFLEKQGLRKIRFHDLRHTNATLLLEEGATLKEVQDWMGHKSFATTADTYAHVQTKAKQRLAETMSGLLAEG